MKKEGFIQAIEDFVKENLVGNDGGHDWWHVDRVRQTSLFIQKMENAGDPVLTEVAALLHETGDKKFSGKKTANAFEEIPKLLEINGFNDDEIGKIIFIVKNISFSNGYSGPVISDEFRIVRDADRLDAMGAVGIARAFSYGGFIGAMLHDPEGSRESTIKHFYDKLLKLKDMMSTETASKLAVERHRFMEKFLKEFYLEWNLEDITGLAGK